MLPLAADQPRSRQPNWVRHQECAGLLMRRPCRATLPIITPMALAGMRTADRPDQVFVDQTPEQAAAQQAGQDQNHRFSAECAVRTEENSEKQCDRENHRDSQRNCC